MLRVLTYHRIAEAGERPYLDPSLISATPLEFRRQMKFLADHYEVVSMQKVLDSIRTGNTLGRRSVLITFDDGYKDFAEYAWPVLDRLALPSVLFIPTAYPDRPARQFWWDLLFHAVMFPSNARARETLLGATDAYGQSKVLARLAEIRRALKSLPHAHAMDYLERIVGELRPEPLRESSVLSWDEIRWLSRHGVAIGGHTRSHPILTRISAALLAEEILGSQEDLRHHLDSVLPIFCYPSGEHNDAVVKNLREGGFEAAFTTLDGHNDLTKQDPLRLRRTNITPRTTLPIFRVRLQWWFSHVDAWRHGKASGHANRAISEDPRAVPPQITDPVASGRLEGSAPAPACRVAYLMSRFPKLTETFVFSEILELKKRGAQIEIYPLLHEREPVEHRAARELVAEAHFIPFFSFSIFYAQLYFICRRPVTYFRTLLEALLGTFGSARFFAGAVIYFPKIVRFAYEISRKDIRHVHAHFANHPALAALIIHRLTGIPFSFTAHGSDIHVERRMLERKVQASRFVVAISQSNKELILQVCHGRFSDKVHVVHCGVDPKFFVPSAKPDDREFRILCVASFEQVKGHRYLIEACRILKERGVRFKCDLAGDGRLRPEIEHQIRRADLNDCFCLHGPVDRAAVSSLIAQADIVALASAPTRDGRREGIPVALMEGMAGGLPGVSTAIGGIPELIESGRTGLLVPPRDAVALADALEKLAVNSDLRRQMGIAAREKILNEFNLRRSTAELMRLYQNKQQSPWEESVMTEVQGTPRLSSSVSR